MELNTKEFDKVLANFIASWPVSRIRTMNIEEYSDLGNHDSFCYWLEYGTKYLGAIGAIALHKFELWKPKEEITFKDDRFKSDTKYAWNAKKGNTSEETFSAIKKLILEIIENSQNQNWNAIDDILFHAIGKWKIAFLYSNNLLLPVYSKRALLAISKGLGQEFEYNTKVSILQQFILQFKQPSESIDDFAYKIYSQFASKIPKRNYYIIGSKYGDGNGNDIIPKIDDFIKHKCVAIGFLDWIDFSSYMGADKETINKFISENWSEEKPAWHKIQRYFKLLSQIKEGDIIAVKSHGSHNQLTIIAYAIVVKRNGSVYEHNEDALGHHIHVDFLDAGFYKYLGLTYAETIHCLTPKKDEENFYKVFGWSVSPTIETEDATVFEVETDEDETIDGVNIYNEKSETPFERSATASYTVNLIHNRIQNRFLKYLIKNFPNDKNIGERSRIDAKRENENEVFIYEIKPFESAYLCIREGIGQLFDYSHQYKTMKQKNILIVGPNQPNEIDLEFINSLKNNLKISFKYLAFDENNLIVNEY